MKKIMVIDDEPAIREALVDLLSDVNWQVDDFATANQALERCMNDAYDLIITDLRMPGIDGIEFMNRLRNSGVKTPVIVMTAFADKETIKRAWELGAVEYLEKPVQFDKLRELVATFLDSGIYLPPNSQSEALSHGVRRLTLFLNTNDYIALKDLASKESIPLETFIEECLQKHILKK